MRALAMLACSGALFAGAATAASASPAIRTSAANPVPACVTPQRLMSFLATRNSNLDARFRDIALWYRKHGEAWRVRWDYAFFQMAVETNFLSFRRSDGSPGDVDPRQNNFAGIGTAGGGVPGDSFPNVAAGVHAQIQHLVVYSGQRIDNPLAPRTQLKQDDILASTEGIVRRRPMAFDDLAGRWARDRSYGRSIEAVALRFRELFCSSQPAPIEVAARTAGVPAASRPERGVAAAAPAPIPVLAREQLAALAGEAAVLAEAPAPGADTRFKGSTGAASRCRVRTASYGGHKTLLILSVADGERQLTALQVLEGFERSMAESFIRAYAAGGYAIGEYPSRDAALARAYELCPSAASR